MSNNKTDWNQAKHSQQGPSHQEKSSSLSQLSVNRRVFPDIGYKKSYESSTSSIISRYNDVQPNSLSHNPTMRLEGRKMTKDLYQEMHRSKSRYIL